MDNNFKRLKGEEVEDTYTTRSYTSIRKVKTAKKSDESVTIKEMDELVPVMPGRFQVMTVDENCDIKGFVTKNGIEFKKGRGFYELSKAETVQQYKEIIMQDRETGEMFTGSQVREKLGLQPQTEKGGVNEKLYAADAKKFRVFVQSTSVNRKLIGGTTFLYEVSDIEDTGTVIEDVKIDAKKEVKKTDSSISKKDEKKVTSKNNTKATDKKVSKKTEKLKTSKETTVESDKISMDAATIVKKFSKAISDVNESVAKYKENPNKRNSDTLIRRTAKLKDLLNK